jgi:phenylacetate-CoA ligase
MVRYAYTVPLYHEKYKKFGVHPSDISSVKDITKLPFITKDDFRSHFPDGLLPVGSNPNNHFLVSTSGSTGKPVFVYIDKFAAVKRLEGFIRVLRAYGGDWRKSKTALVIDLSAGSIEHATYQESVLPFLKKILPMNNIKYIHIGESAESIMAQLDSFNADFVGSDANMLRKLAVLKNNGLGSQLQPKYLFAGGSMLDAYTKKYVEKAFNTRVFDVYGSTEAGPMAFECIEGGYYHVHSDFVYLEVLDECDQPCEMDTAGRLVTTRLYGCGTPVIRYTGIEDIVVCSSHKPSCGIATEMLHHIEGRSADLLILPDDSLLSPLSITGIPAKVMEKHNCFLIDQFQIIQHKKNDIEIQLIFNKELIKKGVNVKGIVDDLCDEFQKKVGDDVKVRVVEVSNIQKDARSDYVKVVVSHVKKNKNKTIGG